MSVLEKPVCDECGNEMVRIDGQWVCPICDDVTIYTEDEVNDGT